MENLVIETELVVEAEILSEIEELEPRLTVAIMDGDF